MMTVCEQLVVVGIRMSLHCACMTVQIVHRGNLEVLSCLAGDLRCLSALVSTVVTLYASSTIL